MMKHLELVNVLKIGREISAKPFLVNVASSAKTYLVKIVSHKVTLDATSAVSIVFLIPLVTVIASVTRAGVTKIVKYILASVTQSETGVMARSQTNAYNALPMQAKMRTTIVYVISISLGRIAKLTLERVIQFAAVDVPVQDHTSVRHASSMQIYGQMEAASVSLNSGQAVIVVILWENAIRYVR